jgi:hypothetical protein
LAYKQFEAKGEKAHFNSSRKMTKGAHEPQQRSITLTVLIGSYVLVMLVGIVMAIGGKASHLDLSLTTTGFKISTSNVGLALVALGGFLAGLVALRLPKGVQVFAPGNEPSRIKEFARKAGPWLFAVGLVALALILLSLA